MVDGAELVRFARKYIGVPYKLGAKARLIHKPNGKGICYEVWMVGEYPKRASAVSRLDCSGFIFLVCRWYDVAIPHGSYFQVRSKVTHECTVEEALQTPGALLFHRNKAGRVDHVGMSNGQGGAVEATPPKAREGTRDKGFWSDARLLQGVHF